IWLILIPVVLISRILYALQKGYTPTRSKIGRALSALTALWMFASLFSGLGALLLAAEDNNMAVVSFYLQAFWPPKAWVDWYFILLWAFIFTVAFASMIWIVRPSPERHRVLFSYSGVGGACLGFLLFLQFY